MVSKRDGFITSARTICPLRIRNERPGSPARRGGVGVRCERSARRSGLRKRHAEPNGANAADGDLVERTDLRRAVTGRCQEGGGEAESDFPHLNPYSPDKLGENRS
jgi:hypothetical protein